MNLFEMILFKRRIHCKLFNFIGNTELKLFIGWYIFSLIVFNLCKIAFSGNNLFSQLKL